MSGGSSSSSDGSERPRVLVVGAGGIGGTLAGELLHQGRCEVSALTTNEAIAEAVTAAGFRLEGKGAPRVLRGRCVTTLEAEERFDYVLLATQPPQVEQAARSALPFLAPQGLLVCLQNGLCEQRVERLAGRGRVAGAVVAWGASMPEPGRYERTSPGGFVVGLPDGSSSPHLEVLRGLLEALGPTKTTSNLRGARWSKLAINCAISTLGTIGGARLGELMPHQVVRALALELMTETVEVSRAEGVVLEKVAGTLDLHWIATRDEAGRPRGALGRALRHAALVAVGTRFRKMRSSMLAAIERGRTPAVDFLNGEVVDHGRARNVATPVNLAAQELVHAIARREASSGMDAVRGLAKAVGVDPG